MADPVLAIEAHDRYGLPLAWSPDGSTLVTGGFDGGLALWEVPGGEPVATGEGHDQSVNAGARTAAGDLVTASTDATLGRFSLPALAGLGRLEGHGGTVADVAAHPSEPRIASASYDSTVRVWSLDDGSATVLEGHPRNVTGVTFVGDRILSGGLGETALVWEPPSSDPVARLDGHGQAVVGVTAAASVWTVGHDGRVRTWDARDWAETGASDVPGEPTGLAARPDANVVAVTVEGGVRLFDAAGAVVASHDLDIKGVSTPVWSPAGDRLAVGGADGRVRIYE